jgi:hypothetical protein
MHGLYRNLTNGERILFDYASTPAGIAAIGRKYVGWGTGFFDIDHHGYPDLFIAHGHAIRYPTGKASARAQRPVLLRNDSGRLSDISKSGGAFFASDHDGRGVALVDLDNDGRVDIVISHVNAPVTILRNVAKTDNHWIGVALLGKDHADVVGARVVLEAGGRKHTHFAKGGGSYLSSGDRRHVFGLGSASKIDRLTVTWPNGREQQWTELAVDRYHQLKQAD